MVQQFQRKADVHEHCIVTAAMKGQKPGSLLEKGWEQSLFGDSSRGLVKWVLLEGMLMVRNQMGNHEGRIQAGKLENTLVLESEFGAKL